VLPQVRAAALTNYLEVARFVGLDPYRMLRRAGISVETLADPEHRLPGGRVAALLEESARDSGCASFALLMAESRSLASLGAISLLLQHEGTARDVIAAIIRYQALMAEALTVSLERAGEAWILRTDVVAGLGGPQAAELVMAMTCRTIGAVTGGRWRPESAHFIHAAPDDLAVHRRIFQCPLAFGSEFNGFACSAAALDAPNPAAESVMARHAQRYLDLLLDGRAEGSVSARAQRSIQLLLPAGRATLAQVGDNLGIHPRALQRLLEKEGATFHGLLNGSRRELALRYLAGSAQSVTAIAQMCGYASPSAFTRWFAAEFGRSPAAWRAEEQRDAGGTSELPLVGGG
jgi:AraC-like DNA-binding protein